MKLLIITQALDTEHPILGFFHRWVEEFAIHCEKVTVICLQAGTYKLPENVTVYSLGKEEGKSRLTYLCRFYKYIWSLRHEYDNVFVHMNQMYVILGAPLWRPLGKKIGLWYAHGAVSRTLTLAVRLVEMVFTSTQQGLQISTPKRIIVGQGIDFKHFAPTVLIRPVRTRLELITVGRISASKNIDTLLAACVLLKQQGIPFRFSLIGITLTEVDKIYEQGLHQYCIENNLTDEIVWVGGVNQNELPNYLHQADIFIHDGATQSLDKVLLEAVASGCVVISSNIAYTKLTEVLAPQYLFTNKNSKALASCLAKLSLLTPKNYIDSMLLIHEDVQEYHSIQGLISNIISHY